MRPGRLAGLRKPCRSGGKTTTSNTPLNQTAGDDGDGDSDDDDDDGDERQCLATAESAPLERSVGSVESK